MKDRRMIVVDLDGTLLNIKGECSNKSKEYLGRLKSLGYIIVIATGRVLENAVRVTGGAKFANYIIANSGGLIYDIDNYKIISKKTIIRNEVRKICDIYSEEIDHITLCDLYHYYRYNYHGNMEVFYDKKVNNIEKFINENENILHIIIKFKKNSLVDKYGDMLKSDNLRVLVMQDSFNDRKWIEVFCSGVSKYNAIKVVCDLENISNKDVIAFGDGLNDVDMIKMVGIGVAMGNALKEVKDVSDYVTISHNRDGVIYFLKDYIDKNNLIS